MNTWNNVAASKPAYRVLTPASVAYWFTLALVVEHNRRIDLRDECLAIAADITEERHGER